MKRKYLEIKKEKEVRGRYDITGMDTEEVVDHVKPLLLPGQELNEVITHRQLPVIELKKEFEIG